MQRASFGIIFLVVLIDLIGFGIVIPILPYYAKHFGASALDLGFLMMVYSAMQLIFSPFWGALSDRIGRRSVLLMTITGTAASLLLVASAPSFSILMLGRILGGFFGANISTASAYIADITDEKSRSKGMGMIGAGFGIGFILGPAIGGVLARVSIATPFYAAAALCIANLLFAVVKLKEPAQTAEERAKKRGNHRKFSPKLWSDTLKIPQSGKMIVLFFLVTWAVTQMEVSFALYLLARFGWNAMQAGMLLAGMGFLMAIIQGGLIGKLTARFSEWKLIRVGLIVSAISLLLFALSETPALLITALVLLGIGHGMSQPCISSLTSTGAPADQQGAVMGVYHSAGALARVIGPPVAGLLFDRVNISAPFYTGVGILVVALLWFSRAKHSHPELSATHKLNDIKN